MILVKKRGGTQVALMQLNYSDPLLDNQTTLRIILPDQIKGPLQSLYVLHGLGDDGSAWQRKTNLEALLTDYQVAAIMPSLPRSWYQNVSGGRAYFDYLTNLPQYLERLLPLSPDSRDHFIIGNSMGGYGTLKWSAYQPDFFHAVAAISPVVDLDLVSEIMPDYRLIFSEPESLTKAQLDLKKLPVPTYWTIGEEDFLWEQNQQVLKKLANDPKLTFQAAKGAHDWQFWNQVLPDVLDWLPLKK